MQVVQIPSRGPHADSPPGPSIPERGWPNATRRPLLGQEGPRGPANVLRVPGGRADLSKATGSSRANVLSLSRV